MKKARITLVMAAVCLVSAGMGFAEDTNEVKPISDPVADGVIEPQGSESTSNTYYGLSAGSSSTGNQNSFFGAWAGQHNKLSFNTAVGYEAGQRNQANNLAAFGTFAGRVNEGNDNTFIGASSGRSNTAGEGNTFLGRLSGRSNEAGNHNTFVGSMAGYANTASYNSFLGHEAGQENTSGDSNVFVGQRTGWKNISGASNTFLGRNAGAFNASGNRNTFVGRAAGYSNVNGDYNVFIGSYAGYNETGSHKLYIASTGTDSPLVWGDFDTREVIINGRFRATGAASSSDQRWKKNICPLESSLEKISVLHGVNYEWKVDDYPEKGLIEGRQIGLVAQEVEAVLPELVSEDQDGYKAVDYSRLTAVLVEAVKELKASQKREQDSLKALLMEQERQIKKQQTEIEHLRALIIN